MNTETTALEENATELVTLSASHHVHDAASFAAAGEMLKTVALYVKKVGEVMDPIVEANHRAHKVAVAQREALLRPATTAKKLLGERMATWEQEQAQLRREAEAAAQRERERLESEARAQAETEQRRLAKEEEDRRLEEAAALEAQGDRVGAAKLIEQPVAAPIVTPAPVYQPRPPVAAPPKVEGVGFRDVWTAEVIDLLALVRAVAAGQAPITLLQVNTTALNGMARSLKGAMNVPGVRTVSSRATSVRTA